MKIYAEILVTCIFVGMLYGWKTGLALGLFYFLAMKIGR